MYVTLGKLPKVRSKWGLDRIQAPKSTTAILINSTQLPPNSDSI